MSELDFLWCDANVGNVLDVSANIKRSLTGQKDNLDARSVEL